MASVGPRCRAATDDRQVVPTTILNPLFSIFAFISAWLTAVGPRCRAATDDRQVVPTNDCQFAFSILYFPSLLSFQFGGCGRAALLRGQAVRQHRPTIDSTIIFIINPAAKC